MGWVQTRRDHGKIVFFDVRDRAGIVQVVLSAEIAQSIKPEWVVEIEGTVQERPEQLRNLNIPTGDIEIAAKSDGRMTLQCAQLRSG